MDLATFDRAHLWHPYATLRDPPPTCLVRSARGVRLRLEDGRELIDGMSSWWAAIHGYNHPVLNAAARGQLRLMSHVMFGGLTHRPAVALAARLLEVARWLMSHVMFGGLTHRPAVALAARLLEVAPPPLRKVFFCDSGSVAVEVAIKMAFQYWRARGCPRKDRLLTVRGGYHGDTWAAMSVCDPVAGLHQLFRGLLREQLFAPLPGPAYGARWNGRSLKAFEKILAASHRRVAAVILEPIVQGAGGMRFYSERYLQGVRRLCEHFDVLLILDEIATGFGRTGTLFACEKAGIAPDIMCVGKALTGGYLSLAATLATDKVGDVISAARPGVFMHGPTFMANPLACAVAEASLGLLLSSPWRERVAAIERQLQQELEPCRGLPAVADVRVLGAIGVVETKHPVDVRSLQQAFVDRGVWVRPFGRLVYLMPPYIIAAGDLSRLTGSIFAVLASPKSALGSVVRRVGASAAGRFGARRKAFRKGFTRPFVSSGDEP